MDAVGLLPYESVLVADMDNGSRLETYVVPAPAGSRQVVVLGPAAKLIKPKDTVIILSFALFTPDEVKKHKPKIVVLDADNKIVQGP
jgi:aspartate 1-decarboxylase